jgi:hypothetical protein
MHEPFSEIRHKFREGVSTANGVDESAAVVGTCSCGEACSIETDRWGTVRVDTSVFGV